MTQYLIHREFILKNINYVKIEFSGKTKKDELLEYIDENSTGFWTFSVIDENKYIVYLEKKEDLFLLHLTGII